MVQYISLVCIVCNLNLYSIFYFPRKHTFIVNNIFFFRCRWMKLLEHHKTFDTAFFKEQKIVLTICIHEGSFAKEFWLLCCAFFCMCVPAVANSILTLHIKMVVLLEQTNFFLQCKRNRQKA